MSRYEISIDEIVVDGVPVPDPGAFRDSVESSLRALATDHSGPMAGGEAPVLHGEAIAAGAPLGEAVAGSVWRAIGGGAA